MKLRLIKDRKSQSETFEGDLRGIDQSLLQNIDPLPELHIHLTKNSIKDEILKLTSGFENLHVNTQSDDHLIITSVEDVSFKNKSIDLFCFALSFTQYPKIAQLISMSLINNERHSKIYQESSDQNSNQYVHYHAWLHADVANVVYAKQAGFNFTSKDKQLFLNLRDAQDLHQLSIAELSNVNLTRKIA